MQMTPTERDQVPSTGSPAVSRRELGTVLKQLRERKKLTAAEVAAEITVSPSKVSRLETGQRGADERDINDLCNLYEVDGELRQHLLELAREGKQRAWWQPLGLSYAAYVGREAEAASISDYGLGVIPGLLQTPDYARAVLRGAVPKLDPEVIEQRVQGRMERQRRLLTSKNAPRFEAVMDESVLHRIGGSQDIMRAQLKRLLELSYWENVKLQVRPHNAGIPPAANNKFIILKSKRKIPDLVFIECLTGDLYLEDPREIKAYEEVFNALTHQAADPDTTREMISALIATWPIPAAAMMTDK
jgi:transcriptional regulator with XRE-family HTH domain